MTDDFMNFRRRNKVIKRQRFHESKQVQREKLALKLTFEYLRRMTKLT